jgi:hypothetical protein
MTSTSRVLGPLAALAALAALAGCGSGTSKADFAKKADALCAQTNRAHPPKNTTTAKDEADEIAIRSELDRKLKALGAPDGAKGDFDAYNAGTQRVIAALTTIKNDVASGDKKRFPADNAAFTKASVEREIYAKKLGFKICGRKNPQQ